jgi:Ca-activated chloride channel family protein
MTMPVETETSRFLAVAADSGQPLQLAMQQLWLQGKILPMGARLMVRHVFRSAEAKPSEVVYGFPLPRDAALRQFLVIGEGFRVRSRLKPAEEAVKEYEAGIQQGHLSTLARQYGDGVVNLTVGNIRPGETVVVLLEVLAGVETRDNGLRFRFPFTLAPSYHHRARVAEVEPGVGEIELPEDEFGDVILPRYQKDATDLHEVGFSLNVAMAQTIAEVSSPSHGVRVKMDEGQRSRVTLAAGHDVPDRDLVLDVATKESRPCLLTARAKDGKQPFAAVVPSRAFGETPAAPRQVVFLLDRSGSMQGEPIEQAKKALEACLGALAEDDQFGIVAFDDRVEHLDAGMCPGDKPHREKARHFLASIQARGGTELAQAVTAAVKLLGHTAGDILILTDGQVMGTERILEEARAAGVRLHCLGIGSASQDRFLTLLGRETGGVCRFLTPRERVDMPTVELFASIGRPVAASMRARVEGPAGGQIAPAPASAIFKGSPLTLFGEAATGGPSTLVVEWEKPQPGKLEFSLDLPDCGMAETLRLLQGARLITDLDAQYSVTPEGNAVERREQKRIGDRLEALSELYGLASRRMSLVAVIERAGDVPGELPKTTVVPVGMPQDPQFGAYFRSRIGAATLTSMAAPPPVPAMPAAMPLPSRPSVAYPSMAPPPSRGAVKASEDLFERAAGFLRRLKAPERVEAPVASAAQPTSEDLLLDLARKLEPDGGMPGKNDFERVVRSLVAVLAFMIEGHTASAGAFRAHVERLLRFLETSAFPDLSARDRKIYTKALTWIKKNPKPAWKLSELLAWKESEAWKRIRQAVTAPHAA